MCRLSSVEAARASDELPSAFTRLPRESRARLVTTFTLRSTVTTAGPSRPSSASSLWGLINHLPLLPPKGPADSARLFAVITGGFGRLEVTTTSLDADEKSPASCQPPIGPADSARLFEVITGAFARLVVTTTSTSCGVADENSPASRQDPACTPRFPVLVPPMTLANVSSPVLADRADGVQTLFCVRPGLFAAGREECIRPLGTRGTDSASRHAEYELIDALRSACWPREIGDKASRRNACEPVVALRSAWRFRGSDAASRRGEDEPNGALLPVWRLRGSDATFRRGEDEPVRALRSSRRPRTGVFHERRLGS